MRPSATAAVESVARATTRTSRCRTRCGAPGDETFGVKWAYHLRDMIPGAKEVIEVDGAKLFFPEERPGDLSPHLRTLWGR